MGQSDNDYLDQVIEQLKKGTDLKRLYHQTIEAEKCLRKADSLVDEHQIPQPWRQVVSYRLAHVLLRRASSKEDFEEIDQLLAIAAEANCLGPLPRLYRLAVLFRLGKSHKDMAKVFEPLVDQIDSCMFDDELANDDGRYGEYTALQNNYFNMMELAVFFAGYPYEGFEGKGLLSLGMRSGALKDGNPFSDIYSQLGEWRLVGTIPGLASTAYPGEIAISELESRMESKEIKQPCVCFKISNNKNIHHWNFNLRKKNGEFEWIRVKPNTTYLQFLYAVLYYRFLNTREALLERVFHKNLEKSDDVFRSWKKKTADELVKHLTDTGTLLTKNDIFYDDKTVENRIPKFRPEITVLGACESRISF